MTIFTVLLAGASLLISIFAIWCVVCEKHQAEKESEALMLLFEGCLSTQARRITELSKRIEAQDHIIDAIAALSTPTSYSSPTPYIVVPGPRTAQ